MMMKMNNSEENENIKRPHVGLGVSIHISEEAVRMFLEARKDPPILIFGGAGHLSTGRTALAMAEEQIIIAKETGAKIAVVGNRDELDFSKIDFEAMARPYLDKLNDLDLNSLQSIIKESIPNKLQLLKELKLSPQQIDYFLNAPPQRLEGEKYEDYKTRRMLNKLLIKYRGQY
jgi:hypothetical protein